MSLEAWIPILTCNGSIILIYPATNMNLNRNCEKYPIPTYIDIEIYCWKDGVKDEINADRTTERKIERKSNSQRDGRKRDRNTEGQKLGQRRLGFN